MLISAHSFCLPQTWECRMSFMCSAWTRTDCLLHLMHLQVWTPSQLAALTACQPWRCPAPSAPPWACSCRAPWCLTTPQWQPWVLISLPGCSPLPRLRQAQLHWTSSALALAAWRSPAQRQAGLSPWQLLLWSLAPPRQVLELGAADGGVDTQSCLRATSCMPSLNGMLPLPASAGGAAR